MELLGDVGHVESHSVPLEMVLVLVQDRCTVCAKRTIAISFCTHPMVPLGDKAQVGASFGPFGDSTILNARSVHGLRRTYYRLGNHF